MTRKEAIAWFERELWKFRSNLQYMEEQRDSMMEDLEHPRRDEAEIAARYTGAADEFVRSYPYSGPEE